MDNSSVITALRMALEANPDDLGIRLHLAELLLDAGDHDAAAQEFQRVLGTDPCHPKALKGAAAAARALGNDTQAQGYERLLSALGGTADDSAPKPEENNDDNVAAFPSTGRQHNDQDEDERRLRVVSSGDDSNVTVGPWEDTGPRVTLDDVGGMEHVKARLNTAFLGPLKNPELMKMYGKSLGGGLMLYGPPGCGKTFIARALAGELGAKFMSIGLSDVLDMWMGESERKLHEIFETARRSAPAVIFFDEIDALGQKRSHLKHSGGRNIVNQLLAEMDSVNSDNRNVFVLGATNHPWDVDTALRRPGRFDRTILVLPPDAEARAQILRYHMKNKPVDQIDFQRLAQRTEFYSGADLAHLCDSAVEFALEDSLASGNARPVAHNDLERALAEVRPSTRAWFDTARNYAQFANEGGAYDELLEYVRTHKL